ncbi:MAG TPA: dipeptide/oligopeptide/nickel ABC transporter ATP-binding protein [Bryobacteraceae bacterium]
MSKPDSAGAVLSVRRLFKAYPRRSLFGRAVIETHAVQNVDLDLASGETLAIVGSSGAGKTTLGRCIAGLEQPSSGEIRYCGDAITPANAHRHIQMVFQDAGASLNPRFTVTEALCEPALIQSRGVWTGRMVPELLGQVGLLASVANRSTSELSGGQKARLAIARALAALGSQAPAVLILDESLGSLDLSTRAQIINLLVDLQQQQALTYILITHDAALAAHMADQIVVMSGGKIVERRNA